MKSFDDIELLECPICQGPALLQEEDGWCVYAECLDCGSHTAELPYHSEQERMESAAQAASLWNMGKVISSRVGD